MLNNHKILSITSNFIIPFITLFSLYILLNGEISPGGGFQAGAIFASCIIASELILGKIHFNIFLKKNYFLKLSVIGVASYAIVGIICMILGANYLDYSALLKDKQAAQQLGIFIIELGVGLCVSNTLVLLYFELLNL